MFFKEKGEFRKAVIIAAMIFFVACCVYLLVPVDYKNYDRIVNHVYDTIALFVVLTVYLTFKDIKDAKLSKVWFYLFLAVSFWFIGDLTRTLLVYVDISPLVSPADILYFTGYFFAVASLYQKIKDVDISRKDKINAAIVTSILLVMITMNFISIAIDGCHKGIYEKIVMVAYPIANTILVFLSVMLISAFGKKEESAPLRLICTGFILWALADIGMSYFKCRGIHNIGFYSNYLIFIAGMLSIALGSYYRRLLLKANKN